MAEAPGARGSRFLVGVMVGASLTLVALAIWMIQAKRGAPVFVAVAGSILAAVAAVLAVQARKKKA